MTYVLKTKEKMPKDASIRCPLCHKKHVFDYEYTVALTGKKRHSGMEIFISVVCRHCGCNYSLSYMSSDLKAARRFIDTASPYKPPRQEKLLK